MRLVTVAGGMRNVLLIQLRVSEDSGSTWTAINPGLTNPVVNALALGPGPDGRLYAATNGAGVFIYTEVVARDSVTGIRRRGPPTRVGPRH